MITPEDRELISKYMRERFDMTQEERERSFYELASKFGKSDDATLAFRKACADAGAPIVFAPRDMSNEDVLAILNSPETQAFLHEDKHPVENATFAEYVVCVAFDPLTEDVVMIRKTHPAWQAGKLNCPGGKVELGETQMVAARREFREETGVDIEEWHTMVILTKPGEWRIYFMTITTRDVKYCYTTTDEKIVFEDRRHLPLNCVRNLYWIIPFCWHGGCDAELPLYVTEETRSSM
jgi:8-oxo-dGTP diphosphatase